MRLLKAVSNRWACATIGEAKSVTATFGRASAAAGPVAGTVTFTQVEGGPAVVDVDLAGLDHGPNPWHVHDWPVTGEDCGGDSVSGHYNPPERPMSGELGVNIGDLANPSVSAQYTDDHLTLFGPDSIVGRSIVIHKADASRWVCATIGEARTVTATFSAAQSASGPVRGTVTFTQVETGPTVILVDLDGLDYGPNPWHVHVWPVTGEDCADMSVSGHYNPAGHPTQGELSLMMGDLTDSVVGQHVVDGPSCLLPAYMIICHSWMRLLQASKHTIDMIYL